MLARATREKAKTRKIRATTPLALEKVTRVKESTKSKKIIPMAVTAREIRAQTISGAIIKRTKHASVKIPRKKKKLMTMLTSTAFAESVMI